METENNSKGITPQKKTVRIADEAGQSNTDDSSTSSRNVVKPNKSSLEKVPPIRSLCGVHYALAFLLKDEQLDIPLLLRDEARDVWLRTRLGLVYTSDKKLHVALILAHNASASTRKAPSKEQAEEMKKLMKITWDPHWYRCDLISKN
ncbi:hypothetical protein L218DRAFT_966329 [Marasmius fiardii PR-910]|nr:hypothetical protein L218DRAFT_966329 [Marasmius fiardii PR-910]